MKRLSFFLLCLTICCSVVDQPTGNYTRESVKKPLQPKDVYFPGMFMLGGFAVDGNGTHSIKNEIKNWRNREMPHFKTKVDDYLQFAPYAAVYGFEVFGMKPKNSLADRTAILVKSHLLNLSVVYALKNALNHTRPNGASGSFPSGHTAEAFAGATMLAKEYGDDYTWVPWVAYGTAASVGLLRIANNRHYLSDVLFGMGWGILSTRLIYHTHQYKWSKKKNSSFDKNIDF